MKKLLLLSSFIACGFLANAASLPQPTVQALPSSYGYFDAFVVSWAQNPTQPYRLEIVDKSGIEVTKNLVENLGITVGLTEYQESEDSENYPDTKLVVTLNMLEAEIGSYYSLNIPAGAINVYVSDSEVMPNEEVSYSFQLAADVSQNVLPEPTIEPEPGPVEELSVVKISWTGVLGSLDLLNEVNKIDPTAKIAPISLTLDEEDMPDPVISFEWSNRMAATDGSAGDVLVITLSNEDLEDGEYIITIPEGYLQVTDIETGTLYNEEMVITYVLESRSNDDNTGNDGDEGDNDDNGNNGNNGDNEDNGNPGDNGDNGDEGEGGESGAVDSIDSEYLGKHAIFTINGLRVNSDNVENLPSGFYIINGKKIKK